MGAKKVRVGIIGAGENTRSKHIPGLQAIEGVEVVSVCNRSTESSARVAEQFGISTTYAHWNELVVAPDTNAIVIGTWPYLHCQATLAALAAGKHVLCEARMAMNAAEAWEMYAAAQASPDLVVQIVPSPMTLRVDKTLQRLIADGYLGDLLAIELRVGGDFLDPDAPLHWRQNFDLSGFNIMSMGIWYEAVLRWVGEATRVQAMGKIFARTREDESGALHAVRVPEHVDVVAEMACGAQLHMQVSSVTGLAGAPEAFLFGSKGTIRYADNSLYGGRQGDSELQEIPIPAEETGAWRVEEEFVNAIRGLEPITHTPPQTGVKYMEFTEAVTRSMQTGQAIALPL
jgi:predicted dehydrogenase